MQNTENDKGFEMIPIRYSATWQLIKLIGLTIRSKIIK